MGLPGGEDFRNVHGLEHRVGNSLEPFSAQQFADRSFASWQTLYRVYEQTRQAVRLASFHGLLARADIARGGTLSWRTYRHRVLGNVRSLATAMVQGFTLMSQKQQKKMIVWN